MPLTVKPDASGNRVAEGTFSLKRLDYKIGEGEWADTATVDNDIRVVNPADGSVRLLVEGRLTVPSGLAVAPEDTDERLYVADVFAFRRVGGRDGKIAETTRVLSTRMTFPMHVSLSAKHVVLTSAFVASVQGRFAAWWARAGRSQDFAAPADVYYGKQTLHEFLERTTWHALQHTRQLALVVETLGLEPDLPFGAADMDGLPLPSHVWDDTKVFDPSRSKVPQ